MATTTTAVQPKTETAVDKKQREYTNLEKALWRPSFAKDLAHFLGTPEAAAALIAEIFNQARQVPELHNCSVDSIQLNVAKVAALRLNPALPNMVAFIPRNKQLTMQYGYAGLRALVMRSPEVRDCFTRAVCANDVFEPPATLTGPPIHRLPGGFQPRGPVIGYFAAVELQNGNWRWWPMSVKEIEAHVKHYIAKPGPAWTASTRPDEEGLTARDKMSLKTCLRMLCNGRDVPITAEVQQVLAAEAEAEREPTAAERQGYDRHGDRPAITASTGLPLDELLQDVSGVQDKAAVEVRIEQETRGQGQTAHVEMPSRQLAADYITRVETAILAMPGGNVVHWNTWASRRFGKVPEEFSEEDWQAYLSQVQRVAQEQKASAGEEDPSKVDDAPAGPTFTAESPDLFKAEEVDASEYGGK